MECHIDVAKSFEGDKHVGSNFHCVTCHGESKAHLAQKTEGAMPDRAWRHWNNDEKRFDWRMDRATLEIARACASCHANASHVEAESKRVDWDAFVAGDHGAALARGNEDAPTCSDCRWAHGVGADSWTNDSIVEACGACHGAKAMMERADLDPDVMEDFKAGKHGSMRRAPAQKKRLVLVAISRTVDRRMIFIHRERRTSENHVTFHN